MSSKIKEYHKEKMAYVYLRQSTMGQVLHHQESTERQYALKDRALACGWMVDKIRVHGRELALNYDMEAVEDKIMANGLDFYQYPYSQWLEKNNHTILKRS